MQLHLHVSLDSRPTTGYVALWIMAQSFEVFVNRVSPFITKRSTEQRFMTLSLP